MAMVRVELRILDERVAVEVPQPAESARLDEVLPLMRAIDDRAIDLAVGRAEASGERVSCCKGCSACCRAQPVPVTPAEAYALLRLVEALPEPRQTEIRERFAERLHRLRDAGLLDVYMKKERDLSKEKARDVAQHYFRLGIVCPFLEDDACSIYVDRPFVCRQYLVTSPAEWCRDPFSNPVRPIPVPIAAAGAALEVAEKLLGRNQFTVPLVLALEYAEANRAELEQEFPARDVFQKSVEALAKPQG